MSQFPVNLPREENPPLDKPFIAGYRYDDPEFPIVHIKKNPRRANYKVPDLHSACPDSRQFPNHEFTGVLKTPTDEVVIWTYEKLPSGTMAGNEYDEVFGVSLPYTLQIIEEGTPPADGDDIEPINAAIAQKKTVDIAAYQAALDGVHLITPVQEDLRLPPILTGATVYWASQTGDGFDTAEPSNRLTASFGGAAMSSTIRGSANASASVDGDLVFDTKDGFAGSVPAESHIFYLPQSTATQSQVLLKVNASPWPIIRQESTNIIIIGKSESINIQGKIVVQSFSGPLENWITYNASKKGESRSGGIRVKSIPVPESLHGAITITEVGSSNATATATVSGVAPTETTTLYVYDRETQEYNEVEDVPITYNNIIDWPEGEDLTAVADVTAEISTMTIPATAEDVFPTGRYLYSSTMQPYKYGYVQVRAIVIDVTNQMVT